jgi:putative ABC transport system ATP-binding protein
MHPVVLTNVARTYRLDAVDVPALVDINLVILPNRFTVISGPSGSGKTTLLNLIGCIDRPDAGTIIVGRQSRSEAFRRRALGFSRPAPRLRLPELQSPASADGL